MSERDIQGNLLILTDMIIKKFREDADKEEPRPKTHAEKETMQESELMIQAASDLIGGALVDLNRVASALEILALSHLPGVSSKVFP